MEEHDVSADDATRVAGAFGYIIKHNKETDKDEAIPLDDGSEIVWSIDEDSSNDGTLETPDLATLKNGFAFNVLNTSRKAGDKYKVRARIKKAIHDGKTIVFEEGEGPTDASEYITVVHGSAYNFSLTSDRSEYPADEISTAIVTVSQVEDRYENQIPDGYPVAWFLDGLGDFVEGQKQEALSGGSATAAVKAGFLAEEQTITAKIDGATQTVSITVNGLTLSITPSAVVLDPNANPQATFEATVRDANNNLVADGTKVTWFASNGYIVGSPTVTNGAASATLSLNSPHSPGAVAVDGSLLIAVMASNFVAALRVEVESSGLIKVQAAKRVLAGDRINDEVVQISADDGGPRNITVNARSQLLIQGQPDGEAVVSLDALGQAYLEMIGPDTNGVVQLDAQGSANIELRSLGLMPPESSPEFPVITIQDSDTGEEKKHEVAVAPSGAAARAKNLAAGFLWGNGEGTEGFLGDVAAGIFIWGDVRDVIKELGKLAPGGEEPDWVNFGLSLGGLALELAPGAGEALDAAIAVIKSALKRVPKPLRALLARELREILDLIAHGGGAVALERAKAIKDFLTALMARSADEIAKISSVIKSADDLKALIKLINKMGTGVLSSVLSVANDAGLGEEACRKALHGISKCSDEALDEIKTLPNALAAFARLEKYGIDGEHLAKAFKNNNMFTHYTRSQVTDAIEITLKQSPDVKGLEEILTKRNLPGHGDDGTIVEIMVAGRDAKAGNKIQSFGGMGEGGEKVDVFTDLAAYQAKRSSSALTGKGVKYGGKLKPPVGPEEGLKRYLLKGYEHAATQNKPFKIAMPPNEPLTSEARKILDELNAELTTKGKPVIPIDIINF